MEIHLTVRSNSGMKTMVCSVLQLSPAGFFRRGLGVQVSFDHLCLQALKDYVDLQDHHSSPERLP